MNIKCYSLKQEQPLLIAFGGLAGELGIPRFEFLKITIDLPASKVFVRDPYQAWYQLGISLKINNINALAKHLQELTALSKAKKVITIGNSAGGYAALLFGCLLKADTILAFCPQTFIGEEWDNRYSKQVLKSIRDKSFFDLLPLIYSNTYSSNIDIYACHNHPLDFAHAKRLSGLPNVNLHFFDKGGHGLAKELKATGELFEIIFQALQC